MDTENSTNQINADTLNDSAKPRNLTESKEDKEDTDFYIAPFNKYESGQRLFIFKMPEFLKDV